ncbi:Putative cytosolic protein [Borrelia nietonii YOR]|uniref:Ribosome maturation factor RimP n=1 Tax=Borrelia nietonii YOR TaxID=1293576 RepID=A0ABN4C4H7_9SPIR|nr:MULTISPECIES: ribosome maturation factor RimP [Borrelia]AHH03812.1 Putative cytosolic protein [Borrelia nietonii YOR]AHH14296.1 Putative cytosolic protein [Borrelia hermsii MTW]UPA09479.1 ribosome maturation factor RimP [Borrelia nietonii YOR]
MVKIVDNSEVYNLIKNVTDRLGIEIIEINTFRKRDEGRVQIILYKGDDFGVDTLCDLHKMILLNLEAVLKYNFSLEISTPGINRKIKSDREFKVFEGKKIKLMLDNDFEEGFILKAEEDSFIFKTDNKEVKVLYNDVKKAKLS